MLAGAALAVSGVIIQTVLANPLAAPHIIGVNAGAGLGVALCSALAPAALLQPLAAFAGAMAGVLLVLFFSEATGASRITLVLAGVAISNIFSALIDAVTTVFPDALTGYTDFRMGGLAGVSLARIAPAAVLIGVSWRRLRCWPATWTCWPWAPRPPAAWGCGCGRPGWCFWRWRRRWPGPP